MEVIVYLENIDYVSDPIIIGDGFADVYLQLEKNQCELSFYDFTSGEKINELVRGTHWRLFHEDIDDWRVIEVYDSLGEYYYVKYRLYFVDLSSIGKHVIRKKEIDGILTRTHMKYSYQ